MQRRFRQVCTALNEHSYVSYAKIASSVGGGSSDVNLIIIKATAPDDLPLNEKYISYLLRAFSASPSSCHSFVLAFTRRFGTTRSWRVALKCLLLLHRLLRSVPGNSSLWSELLWTRTSGLISLHPCNFRDHSSSSSMCYTIFIRSYAQLLDEALNCGFLDGKKLENQSRDEEQEQDEEKEETSSVNETFPEKMKEIGDILETLPQLQSLIDRVMDCCPSGLAVRSLMVQSAMKHIIRDSFICYTKLRGDIVVVLDNLLQMPYRNSIAAFNVYKKAAVQTHRLCEFYDWCKAKELCGVYEYPMVEPIPHIQIKALESFLGGMWQLTEPSSSPTGFSSPSSSEESPSIFTDGEGGRRHVVRRDVEEEEVKPLIDVEDEGDDVSWETLLEYSVTFSHGDYQSDELCLFGSNNGFSSWGRNNGFDNDDRSFEGKHEGREQHVDGTWKMVVYKSPAADNPFSQANDESGDNVRFTNNARRNPSCP